MKNLNQLPKKLTDKNKLFTSEEIEIFYKNQSLYCSYRCSKCKELNWINHGNMDDINNFEIIGCQCFNCDHKFFCGSLENIFDEFYYSFDNFNGDL